MRNYVFKSLLSLLGAMLFLQSNAAVPTKVESTFDCTKQNLVNTVSGYEYRLLDEEGNPGEWSTTSPKGREAREYTIQYREVGSSTYQSLTSIISPRPLYLNVLEDHFVYDGTTCYCAKAEIKEDAYTSKCDIEISQMAPCGSTPGKHNSWYQIVMGADRDNFVLKSPEVPFWVQKEIELKWTKLSTTYSAGYQVPIVEIDADDLIEGYTDVSISSACSALNKEKYKNASSYSVEAELEGSDAEVYKVTNAAETFVINKKAVDYKPKNNDSWSYYNGTYPMPEVTTYYNGFCSADAGKVSLSVESNYKNAGTHKYPVIIIGEAKDNYTLSNNAYISHTIRKRSVYYDIVKDKFTYDGKPHSVEISINEPNEEEKTGLISGDDVTWGLSDDPTGGTAHVPGKNVGHYETNVVLTGNDADNYSLGSLNASSTVSYDITAREVKWRYTSNYPQSYYTGSKQRPPLDVAPYSNGFIDGDDAYFSTTEQYRDADDYTYEVIIEGADKGNYVLGNNSNDLSWKILPRKVYFKIGDLTLPYSGDPQIVEVTAIPASNTSYGDQHGLVDGDDISWHLSGEPQKKVDEYTVSIIFEGADKDNYSVGMTVNSITYKIVLTEINLNSFASIPSTIISPNPIPYDGNEHYPFNVPSDPDTENGEPAGHWEYYTATYVDGVGFTNDPTKFSAKPDKKINVGKYRTYYKFVPDDSSIEEYSDENGLDFEITPMPIYVSTWQGSQMTYNGEPHSPTCALKSTTNYVKSDNVKLGYEYSEGEDYYDEGSSKRFADVPINAGTYRQYAVIVGSGEDSHPERYKVVGDNASKTFEISKKPISFKFTKTSFEYDGDFHSAEYELNEEDIVTKKTASVKDDLSLIAIPKQRISVGKEKITSYYLSGKDKDNYELTPLEDEDIYLEITPKVVTKIQWNPEDKRKLYTGEKIRLDGAVVGAIEGDDVYVYADEEETEVAEYTTTVSLQGKDADSYVLASSVSKVTWEIYAAEKIVPDVTAPTVIDPSPVYVCGGDWLVKDGDKNGIEGDYWYAIKDDDLEPTPVRWYNAGEYVVRSKFVPKDQDKYSEVDFDPIKIVVSPKIINIKWSGLEHEYDGLYANPKVEVADADQLCESDIEALKFGVRLVNGDPMPSEVGTYQVEAYIVSGPNRYKINSLDNDKKYLTIKKGYKFELEPIGLTQDYTGSPVPLITVGRADIKGTWMYVVDTKLREVADSEYKTFENDIPTATEIGSYHVYIKFAPEDGEAYSPKYRDIGAKIIKKKEVTNLVCPVAATGLVYNSVDQILTTEGSSPDVKGHFEFSFVDKADKYQKYPIYGNEANGYYIYVRFVPDDEAYAVTQCATIEDGYIAPKPVSLVWSDTDIPCTESGKLPRASVVPEGVEKGDVVDVDITAAKADNTARACLSNSNYTISGSTDGCEEKEYNIVKVTPVSPDDYSIEPNNREYNGKKEALVTVAMPTEGTFYYKTSESDEYTTGSIPDTSEVGNYTVYYKYVPKDDCYSEVEGEVKVSISKLLIPTVPENARPLAVTGPLEYNGEPQNLLASKGNGKLCTPTGYFVFQVDNRIPYNASTELTTVGATDAGEHYLYTCFVPTEEGYDRVYFDPQLVEITPKIVAVNWSELTQEYDGYSKKPTLVLKEDDIISTDVKNLSVAYKVVEPEGSALIDKGTYKLQAVLSGSAANNYKIRSIDEYADFSIGVTTLDFKAPKANNELTYTGEPQSLLSSKGAATTTPGKMLYALTTELGEPDADAYSEDLEDQKDGGTYYVYYKFVPTNTNIDPSKSAYLTIKIREAELTTVWTSIEDHVYDATKHVPTATFTGFKGTDKFDARVSYRETSEGSGVFYDGKSVGVQEVRADIPSDDLRKNYTILDDNRFNSYEITAKEVSIEFYPVVFEYDGKEHCPNAAVIDGVIGKDVVTATTSGGRTEIAAGSNYIVTAVLDGADAKNYTISGSGKASFTITDGSTHGFTAPKGLELTGDGTSQKLIEAGKESSICAGSFVYAIGTKTTAPAESAYKAAIPEGTDAGTYYVYYMYIPSGDYPDYAPSLPKYVESVITTELDPSTLSLSREGWTYGDDVTTAVLKGNEECKGVETYTYYTDAECTVKTTEADGASVEGGDPTYAGTYYVVANVAATETCEAGSAKASFTIAKKEITITWPNTILIYKAETEQAPTPVVNEAKVYPIVTGGETEVGPAEGSEYIATASLSEADSRNYTIASGATTNFSIVEEGQEYIAPELLKDLVYTGGSQALTTEGKVGTKDGMFEYTINGVISYGSVPSVKNARDYTVSVRFIPTDGEPIDIIKDEIVTIAKVPVSLIWSDETELVYNGTEQAPEVTVNPADLKGNDVVGLVVAGKEIKAGPAEGDDYEATVTGFVESVDASNYYISEDAETSKKFTIVRSNEITFSKPLAKGWKYDGNEYLLLTAGKEITAGTFYYALEGEELAPNAIPYATYPGKYKVAYQFVPTDNGYYSSEVDTIEVEVLQREITITDWDSTVFVYNGMAHLPKPEWTGKVGDDDVDLIVEGEQTEIGNGYIATASLTGTAIDRYKLVSNKAVEFSIVSDQVAKPAITVVEFKYDGTLHTFVAESENYVITGKSGAIEPGMYPVSIVPAEGKVWKDGTTTPVTETFVITKRFVTKPAADKTPFVYTGEDQTYKLEESEYYTVSENVQSEVGKYYVRVALTDKDHYEWIDTKDAEDKLYEFVISTGVVASPVIDSTLTYVYDGVEKNFNITTYAGSVLADSNAVGTEVGKYVRTVSLDQEKIGSYIWDDLTDTVKAYTFTIEPQRVILPTASKTYFIYNGEPFTFEVTADTAAEARYEVEMETSSERERGTYYAYAYLKDKVNYVWDDAKKTNDTITFAFTIGTGEIEIPEVANSYVYTGEPIIFVPENTAYTVEVEGVDGADGINVGNYIVTITPNEDYKWLDGSTDPKVRSTKVTEKPIDIPEKPVTPIEYDGAEHFRLKSNEYYDILGDTFGVEPGKYKTTLQLKSNNYMWSDSTKSDLNYVYEITKVKIPYPANDNTVFVYDGEEKTYTLDFDPSICEILHNKQTEAGNYNVTLSITSPYYIFENGLTEKKYSFIINRKNITAPSAPQTVFDFDGTEKEFVINESEYYVINPENATGVEVGTYERTVSLADMMNYMWADGSTDDKTIEFEIKSAPISIPTIEKEYYYTGSPITFLKSNSAYTVTNGTQTDAGVYEVVITLNPGFVWKNGTTLDQTIVVEILPMYVEKPTVNKTTFAYDGNSHSFGFKPNDGYSFVGDTSAIEPGVYPVVVKLNKNYIWDDDTTDDVEFTFEISKFDVAIPLANSTKYIYNGMEQSYHIDIPSDSLFTVSDTIQTNAGTYAVKVALKDPIHYVWADSTTEDKIYDFVINKAKVALPTAPTVNLVYNSSEQKLTVYPSKYYVVNDSNAVATERGKYVRTVTLVDTENYTWVDGTSDYKSIIFTIGDGYIEKPEIQLEYTYTGDTIVFLPKDYAYQVVNGAKREVGTYKVIVIPNDGYMWSDTTNTPLVFTVVIKAIVVEKPEIQLEYTYTGKIIDFKVPVNEGYTITGVTSEREIGKYKVELNLLPNYMWSDNTTDLASYVISINKKRVAVPPVIDSVFVYNGRRQTYDIPLSPDYNIADNVQSEANTYDVTVTLADPEHSIWSDSTTEAKTYVFEIQKNQVELPTAVQETFAYDGETHYFEVTENKAYFVLPNFASASEVGVYNRTVYLKDSVNCVWADGTTSAKTVVFMIGNGVIELPEIITDTMFTGSPIVLVPESSVYDVENGTQVAAGKYVVTVTLKEGYLWANKTTAPIVDTAVIRHLIVEKPALPADAIYTYDEEIHGVEIPASVGYMVDGFTEAKEPGVYNVLIGLNPNYIWSDGSLDTMIYTYIIERIKVEIPEQIDSVFTFTGSEITYPIADTLDEYSVTGHHRTTAGVHHVTVTLNDTVHYMWTDLTDAPKIYEFVIDKYRVPLPVAVKDSFTFDGKVKLFEIVDNVNYIPARRPASAIDTGLYNRQVDLVDTVSFVWADGSIAPKYVSFYILEGLIPSVTIPTELTYTGEPITLIEESPAYSVTNNTVLEAGEYQVVVTPKAGYSWASDGSKTGIAYTVTVHPKVVEIPEASNTVFKYNGEPHTYDIAIPSDSAFTLTGEVQTEVGTYEVVADLKDTKNYIWSDNTTTPKNYVFTITNSEFFVDPISQTNDGSLDVTPGHILSLDVNVLGNVYKYWVKCDSCPALNIDTVYVTGKVKGIDIMIPDTVKPGVYSVEVGFMSGTIEKTQIIEIRINYPATDIYLVWNDVLAIDNSSRLFETYQWYKNGAPIEGATKQYYQENSGLDGYYSCLVNGDLFVGPIYFQGEKPLWINAHGGKGIIEIEVVGEIPYGTKIGIYTVDGYEVDSKEAEQYMTFDELPNVYLVKFIGPNQTAKFSTQTVKVLVK